MEFKNFLMQLNLLVIKEEVHEARGQDTERKNKSQRKNQPKINSNKKEMHQGNNTNVLKTYKREEKNKQGCPHAPGDTIHRGQIEKHRRGHS